MIFVVAIDTERAGVETARLLRAVAERVEAGVDCRDLQLLRDGPDVARVVLLSIATPTGARPHA